MKVKFNFRGNQTIGEVVKECSCYLGMNEGWQKCYRVKIEGVKRLYLLPSSDCDVIEE